MIKTRLSFILLPVLLGTACENLAYYGQAVGGHIGLLSRQQSVASLLADPQTPAELRQRLETVRLIRDFAGAELALPLGRHYSRYVALDQPFVVWNVFASPEFSLQPEQWCFPVAGCVAYRGYFREENARRFAARLESRGHDVHVAGVSAYSTLGWFADPLLSNFLQREDHQLAALIFHEMAHLLVYVPGDTAFNESFATTVEREGLRRWLEKRHSEEQGRQILEGLQAEEARRRDFVALVEETVAELAILYASELDAESMRQHKAGIIAGMREAHQELKQSWGVGAYDNWFNQDINNALLLTVATYNQWVPAFTGILAEVNGDLPAFYAAVGELAELPASERVAYLQARMPGPTSSL